MVYASHLVCKIYERWFSHSCFRATLCPFCCLYHSFFCIGWLYSDHWQIGNMAKGRLNQDKYKCENRHMKLCRRGGVSPRYWECGRHPPTLPLPLWNDVWTGLTLCLQMLTVVSGSHGLGDSATFRVGSGDQQLRSKCQLTLALLWAVGRICPISPPSILGHCWLLWACLGLESSTFLEFSRVPVCL